MSCVALVEEGVVENWKLETGGMVMIIFFLILSGLGPLASYPLPTSSLQQGRNETRMSHSSYDDFPRKRARRKTLFPLMGKIRRFFLRCRRSDFVFLCCFI